MRKPEQRTRNGMDGTQPAIWIRAIWTIPGSGDPASGSAADPVHAVVAGDVPERPFDPLARPQVVIVHRAELSPADLSGSNAGGPIPHPDILPRIILCLACVCGTSSGAMQSDH